MALQVMERKGNKRGKLKEGSSIFDIHFMDKNPSTM
jgi:hypothetical protein